MYKDIISYELAENTTEQQLLNSTKQVLESWMKNNLVSSNGKSIRIEMVIIPISFTGLPEKMLKQLKKRWSIFQMERRGLLATRKEQLKVKI